MKRLTYISELKFWVTNNPEVYVQGVLPQCILEEIHYFQRYQQQLIK